MGGAVGGGWSGEAGRSRGWGVHACDGIDRVDGRGVDEVLSGELVGGCTPDGVETWCICEGNELEWGGVQRSDQLRVWLEIFFELKL